MRQMSTTATMTHFTTFARLHDGRSDDIAALWTLSDALPGGVDGERPIWQTLLQAEVKVASLRAADFRPCPMDAVLLEELQAMQAGPRT